MIHIMLWWLTESFCILKPAEDGLASTDVLCLIHCQGTWTLLPDLLVNFDRCHSEHPSQDPCKCNLCHACWFCRYLYAKHACMKVVLGQLLNATAFLKDYSSLELEAQMLECHYSRCHRGMDGL